MNIKRLSLSNFRNYKEAVFTFDENSNLIFGKNGAGKTAILEAIFFLINGKSFRTAIDGETILAGEKGNIVQGIFKTNKFEEKIEIENTIANKKIILNKMEGKRDDLIDRVYGVIFSSEDKKIIVGEPEKRRNFIDQLIFAKDRIYYKELLKYRKILKQRNSLLKNITDIQEIKPYNILMAETGAKIIKQRKLQINKTLKKAKEIFADLTGLNMEMFYKSNITIKDKEEEQRDIFLEELENNYERDVLNKMTERGPHRDEIDFQIEKKNAKKFASEGQKKILALSLKLSEKEIIEQEKKEKPIILLDDVFSEIDKEKQNKILEYIKGNQYIITATDKNVCDSGKYFEIEKGEIKNV